MIDRKELLAAAELLKENCNDHIGRDDQCDGCPFFTHRDGDICEIGLFEKLPLQWEVGNG